jgi:hypothetical protein
MSQAVPLTKLLSHYNNVVESFHHRIQEDNVNHVDNLLTVYSQALGGGASPRSLNRLEKTIANRDNFNDYRTAKDATEWMAVDQKLHSYLGRNMGLLAGGGNSNMIPFDKEPNMVQSLRLENAYVDSLAKKMMQSRSAALRELNASIEVVQNDPQLPESIKNMMTTLKHFAQSVYQSKVERDAQDLMLMELSTLDSLAPSTSGCILRCGVNKLTQEYAPSSARQEYAPFSSGQEYAAPSFGQSSSGSNYFGSRPGSPSRLYEVEGGQHGRHLRGGRREEEELEGGCGEKWMKGGQSRVYDNHDWLSSVANQWVGDDAKSGAGSSKRKTKKLAGGQGGPQFRSPAAAQLYNLISSQ